MNKSLHVLPFTLAISTVVNAATVNPFYAGAGVSHISNMNITVTDVTNMPLSKERAEGVAKEIRTHLNVGEDRRLNDGHSANRRVDITVR